MFYKLTGRILAACIELCNDVNRVSVAVDTAVLYISPSHFQLDKSDLPSTQHGSLKKLLLRWIIKRKRCVMLPFSSQRCYQI